jgi:Na+-transporting NADH:ubiquinone oxidoreductase subunit NqrE
MAGHILCRQAYKHLCMEKRVLGIILSLVGVAGLIMAGVNFMNGSNTRDIKQIVVYGVLGAIFFFAGIGLIRNTRDRPS